MFFFVFLFLFCCCCFFFVFFCCFFFVFFFFFFFVLFFFFFSFNLINQTIVCCILAHWNKHLLNVKSTRHLLQDFKIIVLFDEKKKNRTVFFFCFFLFFFLLLLLLLLFCFAFFSFFKAAYQRIHLTYTVFKLSLHFETIKWHFLLIDFCIKRRLIRIYTVCHSVQPFSDTSRDNETDGQT